MYMCFFLFTGTQHRPLLQQHLGNVKKQINRKCHYLVESDRSLLLDVVQDNNMTQLQQDLGKVLMSVKQGFVHIIVYDPRSVKKAVADALERKKNSRVYYPSEDSVAKDAAIN
jgi:hypothetical protein